MTESRAGPADDSAGPRAAVSLRGAGRIQRRIWRAFMVNPDREMTTADLARWAYPRLASKPLKRHRTAIVRAASRVAVRVRRDRPGGVVFRAFGSKSVADSIVVDDNSDSNQ